MIFQSMSDKWFRVVSDLDNLSRYPELIWDAMPKSGASQVHTHFQASMGQHSYYGVMRRWLHAAKNYEQDNQRNFIDDFIMIHKALGLVYEWNQIYIIVNLVSRFIYKLNFKKRSCNDFL